MAPKVGAKKVVAEPKSPGASKRAAPLSSKSPRAAKVPKKCSMLQAVEDVIQEAKDLPDSCKMMLLSTVPVALGVPAVERHTMLKLAVEQVDEIFAQTSSRMQQEIDVESSAAAAVDARKAELESKFEHANSQLSSAVKILEERQLASANASNLLAEREAGVIEARSAEEDVGANVDLAKADKDAYKTAFEVHFKALRDSEIEDAQRKIHYDVLQPLITRLSLDDSLVTTTPSTLMKAPGARGSFDQMVMSELEASLIKHLASIEQILEQTAPAAAEGVAAVERAQRERDAADAQVQAAAKAVSEGEASKKEADGAVADAKDATTKFLPEYKQVTAIRDKKKEALETFKDWNVECFNMLKSKAAAKVVVAASPTQMEVLDIES